MDNTTIAQHLTDHVHRLEAEGGNLYRIRAYRRAAQAVLMYSGSVADLIQRAGREGLRQALGVGEHLAWTIEHLVTTGAFSTMTRGVDEVPAHQQVLALAGVGARTVQLLDEQLGVQTVAELRKAAAAGQLEQINLPPAQRRKLLKSLRQHREQEQKHPPAHEPGVEQLLRVDAHYRRQADLEQLPTIAPYTFNPLEEARLPLLILKLERWHYRVAYSNSALAHRLGRTRDWVVIHFRSDNGSGQRTVVTERHGYLRGRRVVRGREEECQDYYHTLTETDQRK